MHSRFKLVALLASLALSASAAAPSAKLPPLNQPATTVSHPGKIIWSDLFTADLAASTKFYGALFGWEWRVVSDSPRAYSLAYANGTPVAGAVYRAKKPGETAGAHWIGYIAVPDISAAVQKATAQGGRVLLSAREIPDRGQLAVLTDNEGTPFGVLQSSSGDPEDYLAEPGQWDWAQLMAGDVAKATGFYTSVFNYTMRENAGKTGKNVYLYSSGYARAGLAKLPEHPNWKPVWIGFVVVADVPATVAKAKTLGGEVLADTKTMDGTSVAVISDPAGAPIGLISQNEAAPQ